MATRFTYQDLEQKLKAGTIRGFSVNPSQNAKKCEGKRPKYHNEKVEYLGEVFDSKKEYQRYRELLLLLKTGVIGQLRRQVKFLLIEAVTEPIIGKRGKPLKRVKTVERMTEYWADFTYLTAEGELVVEDVKSEATRKLSTYVIKRKLMKERYGITVKEV